MRILVADDDEISRDVLADALAQWGHEVVAVRDGSEAMRVLSGVDSPRLAILDRVMPGLEGTEICRRLRREHVGPYVYTVLVTAKNQAADCFEGMDAGADNYAIKPIDPHDLRSIVDAGVCMVGTDSD